MRRRVGSHVSHMFWAARLRVRLIAAVPPKAISLTATPPAASIASRFFANRFFISRPSLEEAARQESAGGSA
jgi:hypothetical protein